VAVNIRREVFAFGVLQTSSDESAWTAVWDRYTSADGSDQQRDDLLHALCQTTNLTLIDRSVPGLYLSGGGGLNPPRKFLTTPAAIKKRKG